MPPQGCPWFIRLKIHPYLSKNIYPNMSKFIESVENLSEEIEDSIERAVRAVSEAEGWLEAARQRKAELTETLKEVARGGEPDAERIYLTDAKGNRTLDLYIVFSEAIEAEGEEEVQKAVESHLEAKAEEDEEQFIDEGERSRHDYVAEDNDWD